MKVIAKAVIGLLAAMALATGSASAAPIDGTFTYQARLKLGGEPLTGTADLVFTIWNSAAGGTLVGNPIGANGEVITDGLVTVDLDFGFDVFDGNERWLEVGVRSPAGGGSFTYLDREQIRAAPYAVHAVQTRGLFVDVDGKLAVGSTETDANVDIRSSGESATIRLDGKPAESASYSWFSDSNTSSIFQISKFSPAGALIDLDPRPLDGASESQVRMFRSVLTTGSKRLLLYRGDLSPAISAQIGVDGEDSFFQVHGGSVGIGTAPHPQYRLHVLQDGIDNGLLVEGRTRLDAGILGEFDIPALETVGIAAFSSWVSGGATTIDGNALTVSDNGTVSTPFLQIRGGSDLVEPFHASAHCEPGTVVVIDPDNPGDLMQSGSAYDSRVAGVVSGAGGLNPGISMSQEGTTDGNTLVAMTGRVYVRCTAENGPIAPGDLLTTSSTPGHAMRASDPGRSFGAVIGKAMSTLDSGDGLVLVLVNLQ